MLLVNYPQRMLWPAEKFANFKPPKPSIPPSIGAEIGRRAEWMARLQTSRGMAANG